jgi:hypothetical protein
MTSNVFDVYADPEIVHGLVIANVMSDRLWALGEKIPPGQDLRARLDHSQRLIDKYFTHLSPAQVAELEGTIDLDAEARRHAPGVVDAAIANIVETLKWRAERGTVHNIDSTLKLIEQRQFPAFRYGAIDTLHERLKSSGHKASRVVGLSSCLDEAALFAALVMTAPVDEIDGIVILGSASHYTVFGWSGDPVSPQFDAWWFYGKNALLSLRDYHQIVADVYGGDAELAFADRLPGMDTIIAREGSWRLGSPTSSVGADRREALTRALEHFFGFAVIDELNPRARDVQSVSVTASESLFMQCLEQTDAAGVRQVVEGAASSGGEAAFVAQVALNFYNPTDRTNS